MTLNNDSREILINHNIQKAYQAIKDAEMLLNSRSFTGTLNRIYYGIFYIISALGIKYKYTTSKHSQLIGWFNKNFVRNNKVERKIGKIIYNAFEQRMESDYNPIAKFCYEEVVEAMENMKEVIFVIEKLIKESENKTLFNNDINNIE